MVRLVTHGFTRFRRAGQEGEHAVHTVGRCENACRTDDQGEASHHVEHGHRHATEEQRCQADDHHDTSRTHIVAQSNRADADQKRDSRNAVALPQSLFFTRVDNRDRKPQAQCQLDQLSRLEADRTQLDPTHVTTCSAAQFREGEQLEEDGESKKPR